MIAQALIALLALLAALSGAPAHPRPGPTLVAARVVTDTFPHARHANLFTTCASCHAGIASGDTATGWPAPELCAGCHNGDLVRPVTWTPRPPRDVRVGRGGEDQA